MSTSEPPHARTAAELIEKHRDVFEAIAEMDEDLPDIAERYGKAPLTYAAENRD